MHFCANGTEGGITADEPVEDVRHRHGRSYTRERAGDIAYSHVQVPIHIGADLIAHHPQYGPHAFRRLAHLVDMLIRLEQVVDVVYREVNLLDQDAVQTIGCRFIRSKDESCGRALSRVRLAMVKFRICCHCCRTLSKLAPTEYLPG